jgi:hypothetical protein
LSFAMIGSEDDKQLWRKFAEARGSAPTPSKGRAGEGGDTASSPSRLGDRLAPQDEEAGKRASLDHPHLEVAAQRPSKDEDAAMLLAAWLDGRLEGAEREALETRLAGDPDLLDLAVSASASRGLAAPWPKRGEARAAALVAASRPGWRLMAAAAAAVVLVALGGFEMGQAGSQLLSDDSETDLAAELGLVPETDLMETLL